MLKRNWALIAFIYLALAEVLSLVSVPDLALCLVQPEHSEQTTNLDDKKYCPAFHVGAALAFEAVDTFLERHDKSVIGAFTIVLAISTIGLWLATNKLWVAGERQIELARETAADQARDTRTSIDVAERALVAGERAWVRVDVRNNGSLFFDSNGNARLHLIFDLTNTGNSPATKVQINSYIFLENVLNFAAFTPRNEYRKFCEIIRRKGDMPIDEMLSYTLFPGETKNIPHFININAQQINELMQTWKTPKGEELKHFAPHLIGCISYHIPFDSRQHQTGFMYYLKRRVFDVPEALAWGMFNTDDRAVDADDMRLFHSLWGPHID